MKQQNVVDVIILRGPSRTNRSLNSPRFRFTDVSQSASDNRFSNKNAALSALPPFHLFSFIIELRSVEHLCKIVVARYVIYDPKPINAMNKRGESLEIV